METNDQFLGNRKILGVVPVACLILLTLASTSLYAGNVDIRIPLATITALATGSIVLVALCRNQ